VRPFSPISFSDTELIDFYVPFVRHTKLSPVDGTEALIRAGSLECTEKWKPLSYSE
jgi:hypothetical protein